MKKKTLVIVLVIIGVVLVSAITVIAANDFSLGKKLGALFNTKDSNSEVIAKVYDKEITQYNFDFAKTMYPKLSNEEIIDALVEGKLLEQEAESRGITITDDEVKEYIEIQKKLIEEADENDEVYVTLTEMCEELNITLDEYWDLEETKNSYRKILMSSKLWEDVFSENNAETAEEKLQLKEKFIEELKKKAEADIKIYK